MHLKCRLRNGGHFVQGEMGHIVDFVVTTSGAFGEGKVGIMKIFAFDWPWTHGTIKYIFDISRSHLKLQ